jgi:hypothetical protein
MKEVGYELYQQTAPDAVGRIESGEDGRGVVELRVLAARGSRLSLEIARSRR